MRRLNWKLLLGCVILFVAVFPRIQGNAETLQGRIRLRKSELAMAEHLIRHRDEYERWRREMEEKGASLWGSPNPADLLAELQQVSAETGVPILDIQPQAGGGQDSNRQIRAEFEIEGEMIALGKFIYHALRLPGMMAVEKLSLSDSGRGNGQLTAEIMVSRKTRPPG